MHSRKNHDKTSKSAKEADIQLAGLSLLISQAKVNASEKKQTPAKAASKSQQSKSSPRRRPQTRTDDLKSSQSTYHRHQSPSPSRGPSRASSSPVSVGPTFTDGCSRAKSEDGAVASVSSSPVSSGPSYNRTHWPPARKLSSRSRHNDSQGGKSKVTLRQTDNGKIYVRRSSEERTGDPDRLIMDRCNLTICPIVEGEEQLRLLNLQHNQITKIENLMPLSCLMFLDLSDNCVEHITSLDTLVSLRVLMLARNRIRYIEGLDTLVHLDVLDLSGNEIKEICNLNHLQELRVLNLSCNQLCQVSNLKGLDSLVELNLNKNLISCLSEVDILPRLQRLFLAHNGIERFEDTACIMNVTSLSELTLEGCPLMQRPHYRYLILFRIPQLKFLDMRRVLDEEKRTAQMVMRKEEMKRQEGIRQAKIKEAREKAIANARQLWEAASKEQSSTTQQEQLPNAPSPPASAVPLQLLATRSIQSFSEEDEDPLCSICEGSGVPCEYCDGTRPRSLSSKSGQKSHKSKHKSSKRSRESLKLSKKSRSLGPLELEVADSRLTYLAEVEEGILQLYGPGAVAAAVSHSWHPQTVAIIHTVCFHFIVFDSIAHLLGKLKMQFPNVTSTTFECTSLQSLPQLNALGQISGLQTLTIENEGNPVVQLALWRQYAIYRLGPAIALINSSTVTQLERVKAEDIFGGLGLAISALLPKYRLSSLLNSPRVKQLFLKEKGYSPNSLQRQPDNQVASEVVKAALTYNPDFECMLPGYRNTGRKLLEKRLSSVDETMKKRLVFQRLWPSMFLEIVNDALEDYADLNRHMKLSMQSLLKKCKTICENNAKS